VAAANIASAGEPWTQARFEESVAPYFAEHAHVRLDPAARRPGNTIIVPGSGFWEVKQIISDPEEDNDWVIECRVDLDASRAAAAPVIEVLRIGT
jgi:hypothetical protein